ncbi:MAG: hypothetical protein QXF21_05280 [Thermoproteota archaeon]
MAQKGSIPLCPRCGGVMTFYASNPDREEYYCLECKQFLRVERGASFYGIAV